MDEPVDEYVVAKLTGVKPATLRTWRMKGEGPPFYRFSNGTVRYDRAEVISWIASRRVSAGVGGAA